MNELMIFENEQFGKIRTIEQGGEPWFVAVDVCRGLEIANTADALGRLDEDEKGIGSVDTPGGKQRLAIVNEPGLYSLTLGSRKPEAKAFKRWITHEVLPSIRRRGSYAMPQAGRDKQALAEAKLNNSRARLAAEWRKLAQAGATPEYRQICAHYASTQLAGGEAVLPLPAAGERTYTAADVGKMLGGVSANQIGRLANVHGLKTPEYGLEVWDKSPYSPKQVVSWRYNDRAVEKFQKILQERDGPK